MPHTIYELRQLVDEYEARAAAARESSNKFALDIEGDAKLIVELAREIIKYREQFGATAD